MTQWILDDFQRQIEFATNLLTPIVLTFQPIMVCGNGGSAADAEHIVAELVGGYLRHDRAPINAIALVSNAAVVTAIANDYGYTTTFKRQVKAHGRLGGALIAISTSGQSGNVIQAAIEAKRLKLPVVVFTGANKDSPLANLGDVVFNVPFENSAGIQQAHQVLYHKLCENLEKLAEHI